MNRILNGDSIEIPQSSVYLERPRLHGVLEDAMRHQLIVVYAGTGYGKTRMVYSFLQEYDAVTIWIQLSERDNMTTRFWGNSAHMALVNRAKAGARFLEIGCPETEDGFAKFEALRREVFAPPKKYVMVYDDFHLLHNPVVLRFIERASNSLPQNVKVILISRTAPEFNLTGMTMSERVFIIREDTLRFTEDEIAEYFKRLALPVTRQNIREIYEDTRGWAFAVNLIGRSLRNEQKYERYALGAVKKNIFKLIEAEIALAVSEPLWRFLLRISLIDYLSANIIKSMATGESLIREMESLNAYIRYDPNLDTYIIHHLFLDYLRQNQHVLTDAEKRETYQKAAAWCESNGYQADALSYYEKSGDWDAIFRTAHSFDAQMPYDIARYILDIFSRIPEDAALQNPLFPVMKLKLKTNLGLADESLELAKRYAEYYEALPEFPEKNHALAGIYVAWGFSRLLMCPYTDVYDFDVYFEKHSEYYDKNPYTVLDTLKSQPISAWTMIVGSSRAGAPEEYIGALSRSIPHISRVLNGNFYGFDDLARGELHFFRRELQDAELHLKQALSKARERNQYDIQHRSLLYLMQIAFSHGDFCAADKLMQSIKKLLDETGCAVRSATTYEISCGLYSLMLCRPEQIPEWLKGGFSKYTHPAFLDNYANLVKAKYKYQTRQYSALLAFIENDWERQTVLLGKIELKVLEALTLYRLKQREKAVYALTRAYNLAEFNSIIMPFIQYGKDMRTLSAAALKDNTCLIPRPWLENINRKSSAFAKRQSHMITEYQNANNLKGGISLTSRETEILRDLSQGLSRTEIASSQNISINTVKMTVNIIYEKLHASNLPDAIRIAASQNII